MDARQYSLDELGYFVGMYRENLLTRLMEIETLGQAGLLVEVLHSGHD